MKYDSNKETISIEPYKRTNTLPIAIGILILSILMLMIGVYFITIHEDSFWIVLCFSAFFLFAFLLLKMIKMCVQERKLAHFKIECTTSSITVYNFESQICSIDVSRIRGISIEEGLTSSYSVGLGEWFGHFVNDYTVVVNIRQDKTSEKQLNRAGERNGDAISFAEPLENISRISLNEYSAICLFSSYSKKRCDLLLNSLKRIWAI